MAALQKTSMRKSRVRSIPINPRMSRSSGVDGIRSDEPQISKAGFGFEGMVWDGDTDRSQKLWEVSFCEVVVRKLGYRM